MNHKIKFSMLMTAVVLAGCKQTVNIDIPDDTSGLGTIEITFANETDQTKVEEMEGGVRHVVKKGVEISLTAVPGAGNAFEAWTNSECVSNTSNQCSFITTNDAVIEGTFTTIGYQKLYLDQPQNGHLEYPMLEVDAYLASNELLQFKSCGQANGAKCATFKPVDTTLSYLIPVRAVPDKGYMLDQWTDNCAPSNYELVCWYDSLDQNNRIAVTFKPAISQGLALKDVPIRDPNWAYHYAVEISGREFLDADSVTSIPGLDQKPFMTESQDMPIGSFDGIEYFSAAHFVGAFIKHDADLSALASPNISSVALALGIEDDNGVDIKSIDMSMFPNSDSITDLEISSVPMTPFTGGFTGGVEWPQLSSLRNLSIESVLPENGGPLLSFGEFSQYPMLEYVQLYGNFTQEVVTGLTQAHRLSITAANLSNSISTDFSVFAGGDWTSLNLWPAIDENLASILIESRNDEEEWQLMLSGNIRDAMVERYPDKADHFIW